MRLCFSTTLTAHFIKKTSETSMRTLWSSCFICLTAALFVAACGPDDNDQDSSTALKMYKEDSKITLQVDPNFPEEVASIDATIVVGIVNAPDNTYTTPVSLIRFELQGDGKTVALALNFSDSGGQIDSASITHQLNVS